MTEDIRTTDRSAPTRRQLHDALRSTALLQAWSLTMVTFGVAIAAVPWVRIDLFSWVARGETGLTAGFSDEARDYLAFNQSLMGALTAGLGLAAFWFARVPIARREGWGWHAFASSIGLWFVIDNVASVATGHPRNVVLNVVLVAPLLPLLWATRPGR
jgi:hypothetical protein